MITVYDENVFQFSSRKNFTMSKYAPYTIRTVLFRLVFEKRRLSRDWIAKLSRRGLVDRSGYPTELGKKLAQRHRDCFRAMEVPEKRVISPEHVAKMQAARSSKTKKSDPV